MKLGFEVFKQPVRQKKIKIHGTTKTKKFRTTNLTEYLKQLHPPVILYVITLTGEGTENKAYRECSFCCLSLSIIV